MDGKSAASLVISRRGSLRDGLVALLSAMPQVGSVATSASPDEAIAASAPDWAPIMVLLDARASGFSTWRAVRRLKTRWPRSKCIVLAENPVQQAEAQAAKADAVLAHGSQAARLVAAIVELLPHAGYEEPIAVVVRESKPVAADPATAPMVGPGPKADREGLSASVRSPTAASRHKRRAR